MSEAPGKRFETPLGKTWRPRRDAADAVHAKKAAKWPYLRALYLNTFDGIANVSWNDTVALAWARVQAIVEDTYFQNPESLLIPRGAGDNDDLTKEINDLTDTIHKDADTEGIVKQGMETSGFAGFALHWAYHEHREANAERGTKVSQRVLGDYVSPWDYRGDPAGRLWNFKDFGWITRRFRRKLGWLIKHDEIKNVEMLREWAKSQRQDKTAGVELAERTEEDENYIEIELEETWAKIDEKIYVFPVDADFEVFDGPMPPEFVDADEVPATLIAFNRIPEDEKRIDGWWPKPDIELVEDQFEEVNRLYGLLMEAATVSSLKYLYVKGVISEEEWQKIESDKTRLGIPIDLSKYREQLQAAGIATGTEAVSLKEIIHLIPQDEREAMVKIEEAIERVLNTIAEVMGQGPNARYGVSPDNTATGIAAMEQAKDTRAQARANVGGRIYDGITSKFWLLLKAYQQVPIDYVYATSDGRGLWRQFNHAKIKNIDLMYRHRVGSSRPRDRRGEMFAMKEMASIALPFLQANQQFDAGLEIIKEMYRIQGLKDLTIFSSTAKDIAKQLAVLQQQVMSDKTGQMATQPEVAHQRAELTSQLLQAVLGAQGLQAVAAQLAQGQGGGAPDDEGGGADGGGMGTPQGPATQGEAAARAGSAAAGATNIGGQ